MITVYVPDIGDGLAAGIKTLIGCNIQIDCGTQQPPERAFCKGLCRINPDVFLLSHFHVDHYNGLFELDRFRPHLRAT
jgi:ribonuclease BN (tRNA processing enzyme)